MFTQVGLAVMIRHLSLLPMTVSLSQVYLSFQRLDKGLRTGFYVELEMRGTADIVNLTEKKFEKKWFITSKFEESQAFLYNRILLYDTDKNIIILSIKQYNDMHCAMIRLPGNL